MIMNKTSGICVSVDIDCRQHSVAIGLPNGNVLDEFAILHCPEGFKQFFERIEHHRQCHGGAVAVAMEGYNGYTRPLDKPGEGAGLSTLQHQQSKAGSL